MIKKIKYLDKIIRFSDEGEGKVIVLLHGYLESLDIFEDFAKNLSVLFRTISIDLPGHGKTDVFDEIHTMDFMAEVVFEVLKSENIEKCTIIGHSMGGYVALSFLEKYPEKLNGFSLFHSSPFADNEVKKTARSLTIEDIRNGKRIQICKEHCPKTFANENVEKFTQKIGFAKIIAINTPENGIIAALEGMKQRKDLSKLLENTKLPFLYILGLKDNFVPSNILSFMRLPENSRTLILENSGHQGYIEEPEKSFAAIVDFVNSFSQQKF